MTVLERAARALCKAQCLDPDGYSDALDEVRAVLHAIREPSEGMIISGISERWEQRVPDAWAKATENVWRAMIDAALTE